VHLLPARGFRMHAPPLPLEGVASFPIRAYAVLGAQAFAPPAATPPREV
jgi:hypothetical protein